MRGWLLLALGLLVLVGGCDTMPEEDPGYEVRPRLEAPAGPPLGDGITG